MAMAQCVRLLWAAVLVAPASTYCQRVPVALPATMEVERSFWSFLSTYTLKLFKFSMEQGHCQAELEPSCLPLDVTAVECAAICEKSGDCYAFDRPNVFGKGECCLYQKGQAISSDNSPGTKCFLRRNPATLEALGEDTEFGSVWRQPALSSTSHLEVSWGYAATAVMDWCLPWSHCSFMVYDCLNHPIYKLEAKQLPSLTDPLVSVWSYEIRNFTGHLLGRTSELQSGYKPIQLLDMDNRNVATLATAWTSLSSFYSGTWYINNEFPNINPVNDPILDARLVTFLASQQFGSQGWFGPFVSLLIWLPLLGLCVFGARQMCRPEEKVQLLEVEEDPGCWSSPKVREIE